MPSVFIYKIRSFASCLPYHLMTESRKIYDSKIYETVFLKIKKGIPFGLQGKLIRYKQQGIAFHMFKYKFFSICLFSAVIDIKHGKSPYLSNKFPENIFYGIYFSDPVHTGAAKNQSAIVISTNTTFNCAYYIILIFSCTCQHIGKRIFHYSH